MQALTTAQIAKERWPCLVVTSRGARELRERSTHVPKGMLPLGYETTSHTRHSTPDQQDQR